MKYTLWLSAGLAAVAAAAASADKQSETPEATSAESASYVRVLAAESLIEADTVTSDGESAGEIEYLLIDGMNGTVKYAIVSEDDALELDQGDYVAIPYSTLKPGAAGRDRVPLELTLEELRDAPQFNDDSLNTLTDPTAVTSVYQYFEPIQARLEDQQQSEAANEAAGNGTTTPSTDEAAAADGQPRPLVLVSSSMVTSIFPGLDFVSNYVGAEVKLGNGEPFGTIDKVIIRQATGVVAYYLVEHGGFLGFGSEWFAMPAASLNWSPGEFAFVAPFEDNTDVQRFESIPKDELPTTVRQKDLDQLYEAYGLEETAARSTESPKTKESQS